MVVAYYKKIQFRCCGVFDLFLESILAFICVQSRFITVFCMKPGQLRATRPSPKLLLQVQELDPDHVYGHVTCLEFDLKILLFLNSHKTAHNAVIINHCPDSLAAA